MPIPAVTLLLLALVVLEAFGLFTVGKDLFNSLTRLLAVFIAVDGFFERARRFFACAET